MQHLLEGYKLPEVKKRLTERSVLIDDIYGVYTSNQERTFRKQENWKRYVKWLKSNRTPHSHDMMIRFKESKLFIKEMNYKTLAWKLSLIPTRDLYYIRSEALNIHQAGKKFSTWLFYSLKPIDKKST